MRTSFSRRELYALGEMLGDSVTRKEGGRIIYGGGGGGGGRAAPTETTSTTYNTNIPEYAKPYVETMLQGTQKQLFQTAPNATTGATEITGFQPYKAYGGTYDAQGNQTSYDPGKAVAGFQPMQESAQRGIAGMQMPGEFGQAADVTRAGITAAMGNEYQGGQFSNQFQAPQNYQSGRFAAQQVNAPNLQNYQMQGPADVNAPNLQQYQMGPAQQVGTQDYTGQNVSQYMSPYMQNVVDIQQREAQRTADIAGTQRAAQATQKIEDLRAIPWGFSWGQCRLTLPGWYGFGSAVDQFLNVHGKAHKDKLAVLQQMYKQWPFFKTLLSNMDMVMAKSDLALASRYSELVTDARLRKKIFTAIEAEWHRTAAALALITGDKQRLAHNAALQRSMRHRFPYIDPLHHLQVELVRRYRAGQTDERVQRGIHISINGIAAGLRNTG